MGKQLMTGFGLSMDGIPELSKVEVDSYGLDKVTRLFGKARFKGGGGSPPPAPDPKATAAAQATANKETAVAQSHLNMVDQYTPYGELRYAQRGTASDGTPQYSVFQSLAPNQQRMKDLTDSAGIKYGETANRQLDNVRGSLSKPLSFSGLGEAPQFNPEYRDRVAAGMNARLNPLFDYDQDRLETKLINQGLDRGSEAWQKAFYDQNRAKNDARLAVDSAALSQAGQMYGLESSARDRDVNEMIMQRTHPINELAAMLSGSAVQNPQFVNTPQTNINPTNVTSPIYASYNGEFQNYQARQQNNTEFLTGLFSLGNAAVPFLPGLSDRRLKKNIKRVGELKSGLPVYEFDFLWDGPRQVGVMADEVKQVLPHAVFTVDGWDVVNYGALG